MNDLWQFIIFCALGAAMVLSLQIAWKKHFSRPPPVTASSTVPLSEGQIMIGGKPTSVLVLDDSFVNKVKNNPRGTNETVVFKKLDKRYFKLLG